MDEHNGKMDSYFKIKGDYSSVHYNTSLSEFDFTKV